MTTAAHPSARSSRSSGPDWVALSLVLAFAALHAWLAVHLPLAPDETYYWEWSRRPAWGYYDQGPMVAWWLWVSRALFGDTNMGVRGGIVVAAALTQGLVYLLARDLFGRPIGRYSLLLSGLPPLALAGGFLATYDPLQVLFWLGGVYAVSRAVFFGSRAAWAWAGACLGLGMLSKHTMVLFVPCVALFLLRSPRLRTWFARPEPWLALLLGAAIYAPNLLWQAQHRWMTFRHLFNLTGAGLTDPAIERIGAYIGSQAGLMTPLLFAASLWALFWASRSERGERTERFWLLVSMSAPVLFFFGLVAARTKVQPNWAGSAWLTPLVVYAAWVAEGGRGRRLLNAAVLGMGAALAVCLVWPEGPAAAGLALPMKWDQSRKLFGGADLAREVQRDRALFEAETGGNVVLGAATYDLASRLAFYLPDHPRVRCFFLGTRANAYVLWNHEAGLAPGGAALVVDHRTLDDPDFPPYQDVFDRVEQVAVPVVVRRPTVYSDPITTIHIYRCYGYRPGRPAETPERGWP